MASRDGRIHVYCQDCEFEFWTDDAVEAFDRQYFHDTERGHVTIKEHVERE